MAQTDTHLNPTHRHADGEETLMRLVGDGIGLLDLARLGVMFDAHFDV
jgi:hypothetical protein